MRERFAHGSGMVRIGFCPGLVFAVTAFLEFFAAAARTGIVAANALSSSHDGQWGRFGFLVFLLEILVVEAIFLVVEVFLLVVEVIFFLVVEVFIVVEV